MLDTIALLEEEGSDARGGAPSTITLRWLDSTEIGARPRSLTRPSGDAEGGAAHAWGTSLRFAASSGARALFELHVSGRYLLVRTRPGGGSEIAAVGNDLLPMGEVVFGTEKGEAIAWMHESDLVVWIAGEAPRTIAQVAAHAGRWLGQPTHDAVPILLGGPDWAITRALPIPPLGATKRALPAPPSLDGWTRSANVRRDAGSFPACAASPAGARFAIQRSFISVKVDGLDHGSSTSLYDVRVSGETACLAGMSALVTPPRRAEAPAPVVKGAKGTKPTGAAGVAFVRVDLVGKRAEGGERGTAPAKIRRLACTLDGPTPKP